MSEESQITPGATSGNQIFPLPSPTELPSPQTFVLETGTARPGWNSQARAQAHTGVL